MKIEVREEEGKIFVSVQIRKYHGKNHPIKEKVTTRDVLRVLESKNIQFDKLESGPDYVTNKISPPILSGTWIFKAKKIIPKEVPKKSRNTTTRKRRRTTKKNKKNT